jgi:hypothetical protein
MKNRHTAAALLIVSAALGVSAANAATVYTSDTNLADFSTWGVIGTFTDYYAYYNPGNPSAPGAYGDVPPPQYTPTLANINDGLRVIGNGTAPPVTVAFSQAYSSIEVLPNIDHYGSSYDGFQYSISGCNGADCLSSSGAYVSSSDWKPLFDTTSVVGAGEPFTLGTFTGTAPYSVNNVLTPGSDGAGDSVGYEAFFNFDTAYQYYAFGTSSFATTNTEQEFTAVEGTAVPEPATWAMFLVGFGAVGFMMRGARRKQSSALAVA